VLEEIAGRWGMLAETAASAPAALARLEEAAALGQPFRVVLLDEQMPEWNDPAFCGAVRGRAGASGAALITDAETRRPIPTPAGRGNLEGATYLTKPIGPDDLLVAFQKVLGNPPPERRSSWQRRPQVQATSGRCASWWPRTAR
jgi:CheY-like chemotaxis protein